MTDGSYAEAADQARVLKSRAHFPSRSLPFFFRLPDPVQQAPCGQQAGSCWRTAKAAMEGGGDCRRERFLRGVRLEGGRQEKRLLVFSPKAFNCAEFFGSSTWARTRDLRINSPALYRLSYRGITLLATCCSLAKHQALKLGSSTWARTRDLRINSPALYRLSYRGTEARIIGRARICVKLHASFVCRACLRPSYLSP